MSRRRRKRNKAKSRFNALFWVVVIAIIVLQLNQQKKSSRSESPPAIAKSTDKPLSAAAKQIRKKLSQARAFDEQGKYSEAIVLFSEITDELSKTNEIDNAFKLYVWGLKAHLHMRLWQPVDAKLAINEALLLASQRQRKRLLQRADWLENVIEQNNTERNLKTSYTASPNVGPSANLVGEVGVIHLFIEEKSGKNWGLKQRTLSLSAMNRSKAWLAREVGKFGKSVNFQHKAFLVNRNPAIKRLAIGGNKTGYRNANAIVKLAVKQLGAKSVMSFLQKQKQEMNADQMMLLVHVNKKDRSFAKRCLFKCASTGEYTYILEEAATKHWQSLEYTQAHESLHLFGADDLYDIKSSTYYASRDIMNYSSKFLNASVIEPVTAYAIGLTNKKPEAPFKIRIVKY